MTATVKLLTMVIKIVKLLAGVIVIKCRFDRGLMFASKDGAPLQVSNF